MPGEANYLLCRVERIGQDAVPLMERLLIEHHIAIRLCGNYEGLDNNWFRVAVRNEADNERLISAMEAVSGTAKAPVVRRKKRTPALMLQGTSSNAGNPCWPRLSAGYFCRTGIVLPRSRRRTCRSIRLSPIRAARWGARR